MISLSYGGLFPVYPECLRIATVQGRYLMAALYLKNKALNGQYINATPFYGQYRKIEPWQLNIGGWNGIIFLSNLARRITIMNEDQADEIIVLLKQIRDELKNISSDAETISSNTDYTYNVKNIADDILDLLNKKIK